MSAVNYNQSTLQTAAGGGYARQQNEPHDVHPALLLAMVPGWGKKNATEAWQHLEEASASAEPLSHSVSFVRQNKVIFEEMIFRASQRLMLGMEMGSRSQQADPKPWQSQPLKGSHSVVMSQCWHLSSQRTASAGFTGKPEEGARLEGGRGGGGFQSEGT